MSSLHGMSSEKASLIKKNGHQREQKFNDFFGNNDKINYSGASSDCCLSLQNNSELIEKLNKYLLVPKQDLGVSVKGGTTIQFHLGKLPELTSSKFSISKNEKGHTVFDHGITFQQQLNALTSVNFWNKYLKKGDVLCYDDDLGTRYFFNMDSVIQWIIKNVNWRILDTGRIKGDIFDKKSNKLKQGIITYEYRKEEHKKSCVIGACGGKNNNANGIRFITFLKEDVPFVEVKY